MSTFNYLFIVNQLSDDGFAHCKSLLFPVLGYHYMTEADVRRIELCEKVYDLVNRFSVKAGQKKCFSCEAFIHEIDSQMQIALKCKLGSVASEYRNRGLQIIKELSTEKEIDEETTYDKLLTLFSIYLALLRATFPDFIKGIAENACLDAEKSDVEILKKIRDIQFKKDIPAVLHIAGGQHQQVRDIVYIHNVILYCLLMELQGEYTKESNHEHTD